MRKAAKIVGLAWSVLFCLSAATPARPQCDAEKETVYVTASGLKYRIIKRGDGAKVERGKKIALHGIGTFEDGRVFWNSRETGTPFTFILGKDWVIKGCEEGVALMRVGDHFLFTMTPELGYGEKGKGDVIPPNATLIFDYEILSVEDPKAPPAPENSGVEKRLLLQVLRPDVAGPLL